MSYTNLKNQLLSIILLSWKSLPKKTQQSAYKLILTRIYATLKSSFAIKTNKKKLRFFFFKNWIFFV